MCFLFIQTRRKIERDYEHRGISAQTVCHGQKSDLCLHTGIHILDLKDTDVVVVVFFCLVLFFSDKCWSRAVAVQGFTARRGIRVL